MSHPNNPIKDEVSGPAALAKIIGAIMALPSDAFDARITFGQRNDGGWYWGLAWSFTTGSVDAPAPRPFDHAEYVKEATETAMAFMLERLEQA